MLDPRLIKEEEERIKGQIQAEVGDTGGAMSREVETRLAAELNKRRADFQLQPLKGWRGYFVTYTAPSFGRVHNRPKPRSGSKAHEEGLPCSVCGAMHRDSDPLLGMPVNPDDDYFVRLADWNLHCAKLTQRTFDRLSKEVKNALRKVRQTEIADAKKSGTEVPLAYTDTELNALKPMYMRVFEIQARGAIHVHALVLFPPGVTNKQAKQALKAARKTTIEDEGVEFGWGSQIDIQRMSSKKRVERSVRYVTKLIGYVTKSVASPEQELPPVLEKVQRAATELAFQRGKAVNTSKGRPIFVGQSRETVVFSASWPVRPADLKRQQRLHQHGSVGAVFGKALKRITHEEAREFEVNSIANYLDEEGMRELNDADCIPIQAPDQVFFPGQPHAPTGFESRKVAPLVVGGFTLSEEQSAVYSAAMTPVKDQPRPIQVAALGGSGKTTLMSALAEQWEVSPWDECEIVQSPERYHDAVYLSFARVPARDFSREHPGIRAWNIDRLAYRATVNALPDGNEAYQFLNRGISLATRTPALIARLKKLFAVRDVVDPSGMFRLTADQLATKAYAALVRALTEGASKVKRRHIIWNSSRREMSPMLVRAVLELANRYFQELRHFSVPELWSFPAMRAHWIASGAYFPDEEPGLIIIDEAQDMPKIMVKAVKEWVSRGIRVIVVGDPYQPLYSFAGGKGDLFMMPGHKLALTVSFRFTSEIAEMAQRWLPSSAPELCGVYKPSSDGEGSRGGRNHTRAILTYTNDSALTRAARAIAQGERVSMPRYDDRTLALMHEYEELTNEQRTRRLAQLADPVYRRENGLEYTDYARAREAVYMLTQPVLSHLVPRNEATLFVSTVHGAKGQQWDEVELSPDIFNESWDDAIRYVSCTRARQKIIYPEGVVF